MPNRELTPKTDEAEDRCSQCGIHFVLAEDARSLELALREKEEECAHLAISLIECGTASKKTLLELLQAESRAAAAEQRLTAMMDSVSKLPRSAFDEVNERWRAILSSRDGKATETETATTLSKEK